MLSIGCPVQSLRGHQLITAGRRVTAVLRASRESDRSQLLL